MVQTTIIIPNLNGRHMLEPCLSALEAQTRRDFEVIVVDNGSTDGSVEWLAEAYPSVRTIANQENHGYAMAVNQGIRASVSQYVATLNNDAEVSPGWLAALIEAAESADQIGMCASRMLFAERPSMIDSAGINIDRVGIAWDRRGGETDKEAEETPVEVFGPCAGAALYRRTMLEEIGLFDQEFFAYLEDVDLAWRARRAGWRCLYVPSACVLHRHSATAGEGSPFKSYQLGRNKVWLLVKHYPVGHLWWYVPLIVLYDLLAVIYALLVRHDVHSLLGRLAGLSSARHMWAKRSTVDVAARRDLDWLLPADTPWQVPRRYRHLASLRQL
jgi:GT2 family glycosyltransferase